VGIATFNGDGIAKDPVRAYALMTRAAAKGMPEAQRSLTQMDQYIPAGDRQKGLAMATQLEQQEQAALAGGDVDMVMSGGKPSVPLPSSAGAKAGPAPVRTTEVPPSGVGAPYAAAPQAPVAPKSSATKPSKLSPPDKPTANAPVRTATPSGSWRVQLGAFSEEGRAQALWDALKKHSGLLSGYQPFMVKAGNVTRLQAGPLASAAAAEKLCNSLKAAGTTCLVKKN
jgi:cell division septation protein DedD